MQIFLTFLIIFLEYSITTIDFFFLEKVSYLAAIGVASLISLIYMIQRIITLFVSSMIDYAIYQYPDLDSHYKNSLLINLILTLMVAFCISCIFAYYKAFILSFFKIPLPAKEYALIYINYMISFLIIYSIQQFLAYVLYTLKLTKLNLLIIIYVICLNCIFNYIALSNNYGVKGIAIASNLAILCSIPLYIWTLYRNNIFFIKLKNLNYKYWFSSLKGMKYMGFASILEPILIQGVDVIIKILIVNFVAQEALSARVHTANLFTIVLSFSVAIGITLQITLSKYLGEKNIILASILYKKFIKNGIIILPIMTSCVVFFVYNFIDNLSSNNMVISYILIISFFGLIIEPARLFSILSKAYLKAMQRGNAVLIITIFVKLLVVYPLIYMGLKTYNLGIYAILGAEFINYVINFVLYSLTLKYFIKKANFVS